MGIFLHSLKIICELVILLIYLLEYLLLINLHWERVNNKTKIIDKYLGTH